MKHHVLFLLLFAGCLSMNAAVRVTGMKVSGLVAPLGIDETPMFSWQTESDERGFQQQSYAITVTDASGKKVWQSGVVTSDAQSNIRYEGMPLRSRAAYRWTVRIAGTKGEVSKVATSTFETAFLDASEWKADGIDIHFVVPANTKATLVLPAFRGQLKEAGREVTPKTAGVERVEYGDSTATLVMGSGEYTFRLSPKRQ